MIDWYWVPVASQDEIYIAGKTTIIVYKDVYRHPWKCLVNISTSKDKLQCDLNFGPNFDILAKVYLVHLNVKHCPCVVSTFTGQNELTVFDW